MVALASQRMELKSRNIRGSTPGRAPPRSNLGQVTYTYVYLSPSSIYRVNIKSIAPPPCNFCWYFSVGADFARNFTQLLNKIKIDTLTPSFVEIASESYKIMPFQPRQPPFLSVASVVFTNKLLVAVKRVGLLVMRWGCRLGDGHSYLGRH